MTQTKQQRRAARQRKRGRRPQQEWGRTGRVLVDEVSHAWSMAAFHRAAGVALTSCVEALAGWPAELVDAVGDTVVRNIVTTLVSCGWTPTDLDEIARRRLNQALGAYLRSEATPAERREGGLSQWAHRQGLEREDALGAALELMVVLGDLPRLAGVTPEAAGRADTVEERMLAKVRALLAKAESTEFDAEADALTAAAQRLMSRYALDSAMVQHDLGAPQQAGLRRIWIEAPYVRAKSLLVTAVAVANRCRTVLVEQIGFVTVIGSPADLRTVDLLSTSLRVQATRAMLSCGAGRSRSGVTRTRSFRQSFLVAYAQRIGERLREADRSVCAETDDPRLLPVLAARSRAVDDKVAELFPGASSMGISTSNGAGWAAGRAAADLALFEVGPLLDHVRAG